MSVLQLLSEVPMRPCDTLAQCPFISTHLMLPCYTERQLSHNLIYTIDYTFSYRSKKFMCTCSHSSVLAHSTKFRGRNVKHFKISVAHKELDVSPLCHNFTYVPRTVVEGMGHFAQHL